MMRIRSRRLKHRRFGRRAFRLPSVRLRRGILIVVGLTAVLGGVYAMQSGPAHLPLTITDAAGQTTNYIYDDNGRIRTLETAPRTGLQPGESTPRALTAAERTTTYEYYPDDALTGAGKLKKITRPWTPQGSPVTTFEYDTVGRISKETDSDGYAVIYEYDALDRITKIRHPDGSYQEIHYNRLDPERFRDRMGRWSYRFHDALRRVAATRDALGRATTYTWGSYPTPGCAGGCLSLDRLIDPNNNPRGWEYDPEGRLKRETRPDGSSAWEFTYENTTRLLKESKDAENQVRVYEYDRDGRLKRVAYRDTQHLTPEVIYTYDPSYGRIAIMTDGMGTTTFTHHPAGVLGAGRIATVDGPLANDTVAYGYDELGRLVSQTVDGVMWTRYFDSLGRVTRETNALGTTNYAYAGVSDRLAAVTYPNGQTATYSYYAVAQQSRLQEIHHRRGDGSTISRFGYTYDTAGNVQTWTQQRGTDPATVWEFAYDDADQLLTATLKTTGAMPTVLKRHRYAYDRAGNRIDEQIDNAVTGATYDTRNRLLSQQPGGVMLFAGMVSEPATVSVQGSPAQVGADNRFRGSAQVGSGTSSVSVSATDPSGNTRTNTYQVNTTGQTKIYTHDANGNLTSDGTRTFEWDAEHRLIAVINGSRRTEFSYDGLGRRRRIVERNGAAVTSDRQLIWCGNHICEERDESGAKKQFFPNGFVAAGTRFYYARDHLESVTEVIDAAGAIQVVYSYDPYGRETVATDTTGNSLTYAGHYRLASEGLLLTLYRVYEAGSARWLSEDPVDYNDGLSRYTYVLSNPLRYVDPLGLAPANVPRCYDCPPQVIQTYRKVCDLYSEPSNLSAAIGLDLSVIRCVKKKCSLLPNGLMAISCNDFTFCGSGAPGGAVNPWEIVVCPQNIPQPAPPDGPCLERVMVHEMLHTCRVPGPPWPPTAVEHADMYAKVKPIPCR